VLDGISWKVRKYQTSNQGNYNTKNDKRSNNNLELFPLFVCEISSYYHSGEMYLIPHYVMKFLSDLQQVGGILQVRLHQ
jgi:hypothetical protein